MINRLQIKDFQSIEVLDLDLETGVTAITGRSSSGKTAIMRALRTLTFNNSAAASQVRRGADQLIVRAVVGPDRVTIARGKGKGQYEVNGELFNKIGTQPLDAATAVLKLGPLNFASQFDLPFMVAEPPTEVAKRIAKLTGADRIHSAAREANRELLSVRKERKAAEEQRDSVAAVLAEQAPRLVSRQTALAQAERLAIAATDAAHRIKAIDRAAIDLAQQTAVRELLPRFDTQSVVTALNLLDKAAALSLKVLMAETEVETIWTASTAANEAEHQATLARDEVHNIEDAITAILTEAGTCPTCGQTTL